jgi:hypothetical protein
MAKTIINKLHAKLRGSGTKGGLALLNAGFQRREEAVVKRRPKQATVIRKRVHAKGKPLAICSISVSPSHGNRCCATYVFVSRRAKMITKLVIPRKRWLVLLYPLRVQRLCLMNTKDPMTVVNKEKWRDCSMMLVMMSSDETLESLRTMRHFREDF